MILKDVSIVANAVDLSSSLRGLVFGEEVEQQAAEAHGDNWRWFEAGLRSGQVTAQFWQDFTSGGVDETLSGLLADTDGFVVVIKPTSAAVSGTNPSFTATMNLASYERFTGEIGDRALATAEFALAASTGFVRAES